MSFSIQDLIFKYERVDQEQTFQLGPLSFDIPSGKTTFICGRSGSGKSTLLALLGLLRQGFTGHLSINGDDVARLHRNRKAVFSYRLQHIGFALQKGHLLPYLTIKENAEFILEYLNHTPQDIAARSENVFSQLFSTEKEDGHNSYDRVLNSYPDSVSGGQYQRAALARALINEPSIILADEPTGNLDVDSGEKAMILLQAYLHEKPDSTVVVVSHDLEYARQYADRIVVLKKGRLNGIIDRQDSPSDHDWEVMETGEEIAGAAIINYLNQKIKDHDKDQVTA